MSKKDLLGDAIQEPSRDEDTQNNSTQKPVRDTNGYQHRLQFGGIFRDYHEPCGYN
jgi:hypothetical protein